MVGNTTYDILLQQDPGIAALPIKDLQERLKQNPYLKALYNYKEID